MLAELVFDIFKARTDVYATRYTKKNGEQSGYSTVCGNRFNPHLCRKTHGGGTCKGCPGKDYAPYTLDVVKQHLAGKITAGIYPLLPDNTSWWIALDFDDHSATPGKQPLEEAVAFRNVCLRHDLPCYLERSRGGHGVHAWLFFAYPIQAWLARRAALALAIEAGVITKDTTLDKTTFDRFFPNQDAHRGQQIGNLIALPYSGQSTFLDPDNLQPAEDQEAFLRGIKKISPELLERLQKKAEGYGINWTPGIIFKGENQPSTKGKHAEKQNLAKVLACDFIKWCEMAPESVSEPLWFALATNLAGFEDGAAEFHRISALDKRRYDKDDADDKLEQALNSIQEYGPHTCEYIKQTGFTCPRLGLCNCDAPAGLAYIKDKIYDRGNCYWRKTEKGEICISNFVIQLYRTYRSDEGILREVVFLNDRNQQSKPILLDAENIGNAQKLRTFALSQGNYIFYGTNDDVASILRMLFATAGPIIELPRIIGLYNNLWLYGNAALNKDGCILPADKDGIVWISSGGVKPMPLDNESTLPQLPPQDTSGDIKELLELMRDSIGSMGAWIALGWAAACIFSNELFEIFRCFPFLFLEGRRRSGKSTLASMLLPLFGWPDSPELAKSWPSMTPAGLERLLMYYSSVPLWLEEYRSSSDPRSAAKEGVLRAAYNRNYVIKGQTSPGVYSSPTRAPIMLCGEIPADDAALRSRCVMVSLNENERDVEAFRQLRRLLPMLGTIGLNIIKTRMTTGVEAIIDHINNWRDELTAEGLDARAAINYSIPAGVFEAAFGQYIDRDEFFAWVQQAARKTKEEDDSEIPAQQFLLDLAFMISEGRLQREAHYKIVDNQLRLKLADVYQYWQRHCRDTGRRCPLKRVDLIRELLREPFISYRVPTKGPNGLVYQALSIDTMHPQCPAELQEITKGDVQENANAF